MTQDKNVYVQLDEIEHLLKRPEIFIGSTENDDKSIYIYDDEVKKIIKKNINYNQGFITIHNEIIYNAIDNITRSENTSTPCTKIEISIINNTIFISNNGLSIPVEKNEKIEWIPTAIFGELRTGSNFDDTKDRYTSGKNGYGAKLTNVFSKFFEVEIHDPKNNKIFKQTWKNNNSIKEEPIIEDNEYLNGFVKVTWIPDFKYFKIKSNYTNDYINLFKKLAYDIAGQNHNVNIIFNKEKIKYDSFLDYCQLYDVDNEIFVKEGKKLKGEYIYIEDNYIESIKEFESVLVLTPNYDKNNICISFVNKLLTTENGKHCDIWYEKLLSNICNTLNKKNKDKKKIIVTNDIKKFFNLYLTCLIDSPKFSTQNKEKLVGKEKKVKDKITNTYSVINCSITDEQLKKYMNIILKWNIITLIENHLKEKDKTLLNKEIKEKKNNRIPENYDKANKVGTIYSKYCSLVLCEGLSAKTYAVSGMAYVYKYMNKIGYDLSKLNVKSIHGRDFIGIYPLTGVPINTKNSTKDTITKNKVIMDIITILNLELNIDYILEDNFKKLNYGKIIILTDSDVDGTHIKGLLLNAFHTLAKSLLPKSYIVCMKTPILKIVTKNKNIMFYNEYLANKYIETYKKEISSIQYYKGLGTSTKDDIKQTYGVVIEKY